MSADWKRKSNEWLTLIFQNQLIRAGFYLCAGTCVMGGKVCSLDNHCVLFQIHNRKHLFTNVSLSKEAAASLVGISPEKKQMPFCFQI